MLRNVLLLVMLMGVLLGGCSSVEAQYKPLYQVQPESKPMEGGLS